MEREDARCIYKVPLRIRSRCEDECTPRVVSIGPLHHGNVSLKVMEGKKTIYMKDFLKRTNLSRKSCLNVVKQYEQRLLSCYDERADNFRDDFVDIILTDAVFIIEVLLRSAFPDKYQEPLQDDRIFRRPWMIEEVMADLLLLENQVPFFILRYLFDLGKSKLLPDDHQADSLLKLAHICFRNRVSLEVETNKLDKMHGRNIEHLVDFMLCLHIRLDHAPQGEGSSLENINIPTLTVLQGAGLKFAVGSNRDVLDAQLTNGILKLPKFVVNKRTATLIRNMLAFEQCHLESRHLSAYIMFMNRLVTTHNDVELLVACGVVAPPDSGDVISLTSNLLDGINLRAPNDHFATIRAKLLSKIESHHTPETINVPSARCIYRIPVRIQNGNKNDWTPSVISIGPLHHGNEKFKVMESHKEIYLQDFLLQTQSSREWCLDEVKKNEEMLRHSYDERTDNKSSDEFVKIILADAVFIIEVLLRHAFQDRNQKPLSSDRIFQRPWIFQEVFADLLLLENQVPFFILRALFDPHKSKLLPADHQTDSLATLAYKFYKDMVLLEVKPDKLEKVFSKDVEHFVDFMLRLHVPLDAPQERSESRPRSASRPPDTPTLTQLQDAGVKFEVGSNNDVLDAGFDNVILKLPKFIVNKRTATMLRNMLAFEQCHLENRYLCEYIMFMEKLVTTSKDVELLANNAVVDRRDSSDVINLTKSLMTGLILKSPYVDHFAVTRSKLSSKSKHQNTLETINVQSARCIYKVPFRIRSSKEDDCKPIAVSIGPLHHGNESLKVMEEHKNSYLQDFLRRTDLSEDSCSKLVKQDEQKLRGCYDERSDKWSSDELVKIILVDAVFIIEVLLRDAFKDRNPEALSTDRIFDRPWMIAEVKSDFLLLENQVPFFILRALFDPYKSKLLPDDHQTDSLATLAYKFYKDMVLLEVKPDKLEKVLSMKAEHFVDFMLRLHVPMDAPQEWSESGSSETPTLTELHQAGVKFMVGSNHDVTDAEFIGGDLKLPSFIVDRRSVRMIRNMLAFEQCHYERRRLSEYILFMNNLVTTPKDVNLLVEYGIVASTPPDSSEVVGLISSLTSGVLLLPGQASHFAPTSASLRDYVEKPWNNWKANLKQKYFNTPWAIISVVAGTVVIILTILQTVFSIFSPNK